MGKDAEMTEESHPEKKKLQLTPLKLAVGLAVIVVVVIGVFGGIGWSLGRSMAPGNEAASENTEATTDSIANNESETQASSDTQSTATGPTSEPAESQPQAGAPEQEQAVEQVSDNGMTVLYENEYYIVSLPSDKVGYAKWLRGGGLDKNTKWDTFSYDPPGENNGAGVTITTAFVDASSSTESYFDQFLGRGSSGVYVYAMEAGGSFFSDAGAGGVVTLK